MFHVRPGSGIDEVLIGMPRILAKKKVPFSLVHGDYDSMRSEDGRFSIEFREGRVYRISLLNIDPCSVTLGDHSMKSFSAAEINAALEELFGVVPDSVEDGLCAPSIGLEFWSMDITNGQYSSIHVISPK